MTMARTPTIKSICDTTCYLSINIVLLAFYASILETMSDGMAQYKGLSITGNVFMMIGYLLIIALHFKYIFYAALGIIATMNFGMFLLLIGMGIGAQEYQYFKYNIAIAFWFIQLAIDILGMQVVYKIYKINQDDQSDNVPQQNNEANKAANNASQPQVQL
ncbi:unnamed protein product (macronuclear) [Paramecium tetraurelia]|uniref:Transmembrane protein 107 n=1 Tax=Paramecium tetraurelia TaxID=5888 RepID=A0C8T6_PARTE|nr:uncharacterized protein GSPATT00036338001 [Paramecium tetraurelia]CAK67203.1 unnamed protein product [Paramecium tetraurelia]|eukprot:XP_001434600.1 hypothetical protein (macronuclear) [Paramecium tetraurelia strain d4-2]